MSHGYGPGFPVDEMSGQRIGQSALYGLTPKNTVAIIGPQNPLNTVDFLDAVGQGKVPMWRLERKFGDAMAIGTTQQPLWPSALPFTFLTDPEIFRITSTSTDDDVGGSGATSILFEGIRANGSLGSEIVDMQGNGNAFTINEYFNVHRETVLTAGAGPDKITGIVGSIGAAGTISTFANDTGSLQGLITPGNNITTQLVFRVPDDEEWTIVRSQSSVSQGKTVEFKAYSRQPGETVFSKASETNIFESLFASRLYSTKLESGTEFVVLAVGAAAGTAASGVLDILVNELPSFTY